VLAATPEIAYHDKADLERPEPLRPQLGRSINATTLFANTRKINRKMMLRVTEVGPVV
jgi:redox-regulated HSP33 family molecular chaperone